MHFHTLYGVRLNVGDDNDDVYAYATKLTLVRIRMLCSTRYYKWCCSNEIDDFDIILFQIYWSICPAKIIKI